MTQIAESVEAYLARGREIRTRMRETAGGVVHEVPWDAQANVGFSGRPDELVRVLEDLARRGLVTRFETVHPFDSSEYIVTWRLAG